MSSSFENPLRAKQIPESVRIVNWPIRDDGIWGWLMVTGFVAIGAFASTVSESPIMGLLAFAVLAVAAWRLWIPVTFDFSLRGVTQTILRRRRRIPWNQIARYEVYPKGVLLLAEHARSPLSPFRGLFVGWGKEKENLMRILEFYLEPIESEGVISTETYQVRDADHRLSGRPSTGPTSAVK